MGPFHEQVTQRIVYEKAGQRFNRRAGPPRPRHECDPRGREELNWPGGISRALEISGNLSGNAPALGDSAVAAHLSAMLFRRVPWSISHRQRMYLRMKSRPASARSWPTACRANRPWAIMQS